MKKGILIFALGHDNYYHMAEVLAASLICNKRANDGISIAVICDDAEKFVHPSLFTQVITIPHSMFTVDGKIVFNHATTHVYELSPFDVTMKLDADIVWLPNRSPADLFHSLRDVNLTFENTGFAPLAEVKQEGFVWANPLEVKKAYNLTGKEKAYSIFGEFLWFKKTEAIENFFELVCKVYDSPKVACSAFANGSFTDELAFQIASMITKRYPHIENFTPVFNIFLKKKNLLDRHAYQLPPNFYGYSIGGNQSTGWQKTQYNILAQSYFKTLGLFNPYQATNKKSFLPERLKL